MTDETTPEPRFRVGETLTREELARRIDMPVDRAFAQVSVFGGVRSESRFDPAARALTLSSPSGDIIVVGDVVAVRPPDGEWIAADAGHDDEETGELSELALTMAESSFDAADATHDTDPATVIPAAAEMTVTASETREGREMFTLTGTQTVDGADMTITDVVSDDGVLWHSVTEIDGQPALTMSIEMTAWDEPQHIASPL